MNLPPRWAREVPRRIVFDLRPFLETAMRCGAASPGHWAPHCKTRRACAGMKIPTALPAPGQLLTAHAGTGEYLQPLPQDQRRRAPRRSVRLPNERIHIPIRAVSSVASIAWIIGLGRPIPWGLALSGRRLVRLRRTVQLRRHHRRDAAVPARGAERYAHRTSPADARWRWHHR